MSWQHEAQFQSVGPCLVSSACLLRLLRLVPTASFTATNCWAQESACLYNNCQYSGVGSDWGRGDLHNVIFNSSCLCFNSRHQKGSNPFSTSSIKSFLSLHSWWGIQEDSFPPTSTVSLILWRQAGDSSPYAQICSTVTFWWNWFQTCIGERAGLHPRLINNSLFSTNK